MPQGGFPAGSVWALGGALACPELWSLATTPKVPVGGRGEQGSLGRGCPASSPLTFYTQCPWCCQHRWPGGHYIAGWAPRGLEACAHTHTHTDTRALSFHPSTPGLVPGLTGAWAAAQQQQHSGWAPPSHHWAQPAGQRPFTSAGPRRWVGLGAAGHGRTRSRPLRSWSWGCPGHLVSTAQRALTGPGTPAGGRPGGRAAVRAVPSPCHSAPTQLSLHSRQWRSR